jgi:hypothetical protein
MLIAFGVLRHGKNLHLVDGRCSQLANRKCFDRLVKMVVPSPGDTSAMRPRGLSPSLDYASAQLARQSGTLRPRRSPQPPYRASGLVLRHISDIK